MSRRGQSRAALRRRHDELVIRSSVQRLKLKSHVQQIEQQLAPVDRGLGLMQQVATPAVVLGAAVSLTLMLGRRRMRRLLGSSLAVAGIALRWRSAARLLGRFRWSGGRGAAVPGTTASRARTP